VNSPKRQYYYFERSLIITYYYEWILKVVQIHRGH